MRLVANIARRNLLHPSTSLSLTIAAAIYIGIVNFERIYFWRACRHVVITVQLRSTDPSAAPSAQLYLSDESTMAEFGG